tara:strand:- start:31 stop:249 length:219 start_codon:yes stop_codon:yes gene_type:complete
MVSQKNAVLQYLSAGYTITPLEALEMFQCMRLAAVIKILRDDGHNIITKTVKSKGSGKSYASYRLIPTREAS